MRTLLMLVGAAPMVLANISESPVRAASTVQKKDCGCSIAEAKRVQAVKEGPTTAAARRCVAKADVQELCTLTNTTMEQWCASGGIFATCETSGDNDGDGTYGEPHFMQKRYIETYSCSTGSYIICGGWTPMKIGGGSSGQDVCCNTSTSEPPCPANSCPPNP